MKTKAKQWRLAPLYESKRRIKGSQTSSVTLLEMAPANQQVRLQEKKQETTEDAHRCFKVSALIKKCELA